MKTEIRVSVQVETSINDYVYVRLTEEGKKYLKRYFFDDKNLPPDLKKELFELRSRTDKEGWSKFELWDLMHIFGPIMYMANPIAPFEHNVVRIGEREEGEIQITSAD